MAVEEVEVPGAKDTGVENLGDEGDTLGAPITVDRENEDELGEDMGNVSQVAEDLQQRKNDKRC